MQASIQRNDTEVALTFALLGPVCAWHGGVEIALGTPQQRAVLALLLLREGKSASAEDIINAVWGEAAPSTAKGTIRTYLHRLRRVFSAVNLDDVLVLEKAGYALRVDPEAVDVGQFRRIIALADAARGEGDRGRVAEHLRSALSLFRGEPLSGVFGEFVEGHRTRLNQMRLTAQERLFDVEMERGRHQEIVGQLHAIVAEEPLRETFWELLILALYRCGRQAESLVAYEDVRQLLRNELGTVPGPRLRELHQRVLRSDPELLPSQVDSSESVSLAKPAQLPAALPVFVGRTDELTTIVDELAAGDEQTGRLRVTFVRGTAGVGKTAFALHLAHEVADRFPDGQLYVNLRGADGVDVAADPRAVVRGFLDALGVSLRQIPAEVDAQFALYRSLVADRRMLVLLDNARESAQVLPLLPGGSRSLSVVTSRNQLEGLITSTGAHTVALGLLSEEEAWELLARRLGAARVAAEPDAARDIINRCARLPLAMSVVCARISSQPPEFLLADIAAELFDTHATLDAFASEDVDIRAVLSSSYSSLSKPAARLFRLLSLHPGPEISVPAAASLAAEAVRPARSLLREIVDAHLIAQIAPGRFVWHNLLLAFATERREESDTAVEQQQAFRRMADHYLHSADRAARLVSAKDDRPELPDIADSVTPADLRGTKDAMSWFAAEQAATLPVLARMVERGLFDHAWRFAWSVRHFQDRQGRWHDLAATQDIAMQAAVQTSDRRALGFAHRGVARAETRLRRYDQAQEHLDRALSVFEEAQDVSALAYTLRQGVWLSELRGESTMAWEQARRARDLFRSNGDIVGEAAASNSLGWCCVLLGEYEEAVVECNDALLLYAKSDEKFGQADVWDSLGYAYHHLGRYEEAGESYRQALDIYRDFDAYDEQVATLLMLSSTYRMLGLEVDAEDVSQRAACIQDSLVRSS